MIVLLSLLTLANGLTFVLAAPAVLDPAEYGIDNEFAGPLAFSVTCCGIGLVGLGGSWLTEKWGPRLYFGAIVIERIVILVWAPELFSPFVLIGVVLAAVLLRNAEREW